MLPFETVPKLSEASRKRGALAASSMVRPHSRMFAAATKSNALLSSPTLSSAALVLKPMKPAPTNSPKRVRPPGLPDGRSSSAQRKTSPPRSLDVVARQVGSAYVVDVCSSPKRTPAHNATTELAASGIAVHDLVPALVPRIDLKRYDLAHAVPAPNFRCATIPRMLITVDPPVIDCDEGVETVVVERFCCRIVDVHEVDVDRALEYHVFVEVPGLFEETPEVDAASGTLSFAPKPHSTGLSVVWARLADNAAITAEGLIATSEPTPFVVRVNSMGSSSASRRTVDWRAHAHKSALEVAAILDTQREQDATAAAHNQNTLVKRDEYTPTSEGFPLSNPFALRYEEVFNVNGGALSNSQLASSQPSGPGPHLATFDLGSSDNSAALARSQQAPRTNARLAPMSLLPFSHVCDDMDLVRMPNDILDRDRLVGEVASADTQAKIESDISSLLAAEEQRLGADSIELCPLALRCAQICIAQGAPRHKDAVQFLQQVVRIRGLFAGVLPSNVVPSQMSEEQAERVDAYLQSLTMVGAFLKLSGRYRDSLEYFTTVLKLAEQLEGGCDSLGYISALSSIGEVHYHLGEFRTAASDFSRCIAGVGVLFGPDSPQTYPYLHLHAMCLSAQGEHHKALAQHEEALKLRRGEYDKQSSAVTGGIHSLVALLESLIHVAQARCVAGLEEQTIEAGREVLNLLKQYDLNTQLHCCAMRCVVLSILGEAYTKCSDPNALSIVEMAANEANRLRGFDGVETCIFDAQVAATRMTVEASTTSTKTLEHARQVFTTALGAHHPYVTRTVMLLAHSYLQLRAASTALSYAEPAVAAAEQLDPMHIDRAHAKALLARAHLCLRNSSIARENIVAALEIARFRHVSSMENQLLSQLCGTYCMMSTALPSDVVASLEERVRHLKKAVGDASSSLVPPLEDLSAAHYLLQEYDKAHAELSKALKIADSFNMIFLLGKLFRPASQLTAAELQERNRIAADRLSVPVAVDFARLLYGIACIFEAEGKLDEAQNTLLQALASMEVAEQSDSIAAAAVLGALGRNLFRDGHFGDALAYVERAYNLLLEHHPSAQLYLHDAFMAIHIVNAQIRKKGYSLLRHQETRHRFAIFI